MYQSKKVKRILNVLLVGLMFISQTGLLNVQAVSVDDEKKVVTHETAESTSITNEGELDYIENKQKLSLEQGNSSEESVMAENGINEGGNLSNDSPTEKQKDNTTENIELKKEKELLKEAMNLPIKQ